MDDFELLQAYTSQGQEEAFSTLTARYLGLVYSAAVRQTGHVQAAEDVTQAVFLILARKAGALPRNIVLSAWLLRTTRYVAANARRLEQRRQYYEQQAMESSTCLTENESIWPRIAPLLDEALDRLNERDRDAIALRFFERKSLKHVAGTLKTSEDGAQKCVSRALEKLRLFFARRGKHVSAVALAAALTTNSVQSAPGALADKISAAVALSAPVAGSAVALLTQAALAALARARLQLLAVRTASVGVLLGVAVVAFVHGTKGTLPPEPALTQSTNAQSLRSAAVETPNAVQASPAALGAIDPNPGTALRQLLLQVVDAQSGASVTNARLTFVSTTARPETRVTNIFMTDAQGASVLSYAFEPVKSWSQRIEIYRDNYVPRFLSWSESQQDRFDEIPVQYTVKLDPAVAIGGLVVDEQDVPVAAMKVVFSVSGPIAHNARERLTMMGHYHTEITDAVGRWNCTHVPTRFGMISYHLVHPEFQETEFASDSAESPSYVEITRVTEADLLASRTRFQVRRGLVIAGSVTDENGQPVPGAKVTQGYDFRNPERTRLTASDGSFRFGNGRPHELALTIQAAGLAPVVTSFVANVSLPNLRFTLPSGRQLSGRVVDETGEPVAGATIEAASPSGDSRTQFEWSARTDADGRFSWQTAPATQIYAVYASGYETQSRVTLAAGGTEEVIKLNKKTAPRPVRIVGEVLDAETGMPPSNTRVQIWETAKQPGGGWSTFTTRPQDVPADGKFRLKTSSSTVRYVLEVQADGCRPERFTNEVTGEPELRLRLELAKAPSTGGMVLTPSGEPAVGATLAVCGPDEWAQMNQPGKLHLGAHAPVVGTVSDAAGRFRLPAKYAAEVVVAAHAAGWAEVPYAQLGSNTVLTLQRWGSIEGTLVLDGRPRANETITLGSLAVRTDRSRFSLFLNAKTDGNGHFAFNMVPPGERKVDWRPNFRDGKVGVVPLSHGVPVTVTSDATARVVLGGTGRAVVGKVFAPPTDKPVDWRNDVHSFSLKLPGPPQTVYPKPADYDSESDYNAANRRIGELNRAFWRSEAGQAVLEAQRTYIPLFEEDGTFRIDDVPPGTYLLKVIVTEPSKAPSPFPQGPIIGSLETEIVVPESAEHAAFDLGALSLTGRPAN